MHTKWRSLGNFIFYTCICARKSWKDKKEILNDVTKEKIAKKVRLNCRFLLVAAFVLLFRVWTISLFILFCSHWCTSGWTWGSKKMVGRKKITERQALYKIWHRNVLKSVPHVQHDYFIAFNQPSYKFVLSSSLLPSLLSLKFSRNISDSVFYLQSEM